MSAREVTVSCEKNSVTTTTSTTRTDWILNPSATAWVPGEPVSTTSVTTRRAVHGDCPDNSDAGTPNGAAPPADSPAADGGGGDGFAASVGAGLGAGLNALAHAGADAAVAISLAISLLAAGAILVLRRRGASAPTSKPASD